MTNEQIMQMLRDARDLGLEYGRVEGLLSATEKLQTMSKHEETRNPFAAVALHDASQGLLEIAKAKANELHLRAETRR